MQIKLMSTSVWNSPKINAMEHLWWQVNIGSGNGFVPSGSKAFIAWANVDLDLCGNIATLVHNELIHSDSELTSKSWIA